LSRPPIAAAWGLILDEEPRKGLKPQQWLNSSSPSRVPVVAKSVISRSPLAGAIGQNNDQDPAEIKTLDLQSIFELTKSQLCNKK
jgi:hypothetical protein